VASGESAGTGIGVAFFGRARLNFNRAKISITTFVNSFISPFHQTSASR
jgi:hypothetical protein